MHLMGCQNITAMVGSRKLFTDITLGIEDADKIGVLGPNGGGKTSLLRILAQKQTPDEGTVTLTSGTTIAMLDQQDVINPEWSVTEAIYGKAEEYEWASDSTIREIHAGLLTDIKMDTKIKTLSGGQKRRVALAQVLSKNADITFLDEPTNHLDIVGITWLANFLNTRYNSGKGALVVVTHDRWFLDTVCTKIWEVVPGLDAGNGTDILPGTLEMYQGSYAAYILARAERDRQHAVTAQKRNNLLKKELAWLRRGAPARTSKPKFRINEAETLISDVPPVRNKVELVKLATSRLGKNVVDLENVTVDYSENKNTPILKNITWRIGPGDRVGILGANGAGKTTLMRLIEGSQQPNSGIVKFGKTVKIGVLSQSTHELDEVADLRVVEAVSIISNAIVVDGKELSASQFVKRLGFSKSRAWTRVSELSGGERRRLQFMRILMREPNVLLLDEPTNDLDTDTLVAMEDILDGFPTTLIVVSHDKYLLERVSDYQMLVKDGSVRMLPGGVDEYMSILESTVESKVSTTHQENAKSETEEINDDSSSTNKPRLSGSERHQLSKELAAVERKMQKNEIQIEELNSLLVALSADPSKIDELIKTNKQLQVLEENNIEYEQRWFELNELLEE